jgi:hypothetical protein
MVTLTIYLGDIPCCKITTRSVRTMCQWFLYSWSSRKQSTSSQLCEMQCRDFCTFTQANVFECIIWRYSDNMHHSHKCCFKMGQTALRRLLLKLGTDWIKQSIFIYHWKTHRANRLPSVLCLVISDSAHVTNLCQGMPFSHTVGQGAGQHGSSGYN